MRVTYEEEALSAVRLLVAELSIALCTASPPMTWEEPMESCMSDDDDDEAARILLKEVA